MNTPQTQPIDIDEIRRWLIDHRAATGLSWTDLAKRTGIASGTISQFGSERGYAGDEQRIAVAIAKYRQGLAIQADLEVEAPEIPEYVETPTSVQMVRLYQWAQRGRIVVIATGPGTGKTKSAEHYRDAVANVWLSTMMPSTANVNTMQIAVLKAMGEPDAKGTPQALTHRIVERVAKSGGLIIIDEAQHLSEKAVEEIRGWHDATGIGIALQGNETVIARLEGGSRKAAYAQLFSRVSMRFPTRAVALQGDADAIADAWGVTDDQQRAYVRRIAQLPGSLRGATMMLELATLLSRAEARQLALSDLQDAWTQLSARPVL